MRYDGARLADFSVSPEKSRSGQMDLSFFCCCLGCLRWGC